MKVIHRDGCAGDLDEAVVTEVSSNAAVMTAFRSYRRYICRACGAVSQWKRIDPWRFKFPDEGDQD